MAELIAYFSRAGENYLNGVIKNLTVGNTEVAAKMVAELSGGDLFQLVPIQAYSDDYNQCINEAQDDQRRNARPELKEYPDNLDGYDTIYLGFPNYWGTMPMCVFTFLEHFDFAGKTILPFCTHEGSGMGKSEADIKNLCPGAKVKAGLAIHGAEVAKAERLLEKWIEKENRK